MKPSSINFVAQQSLKFISKIENPRGLTFTKYNQGL